MSIGSATDLTGLRAVAHIVRLTLERLEDETRPGVTTGELDRIAADLFAENGAESAPSVEYNFPGTVLISVNDEVVHGIPGSRVLASGDVVKIDVTAQKDGYVADAARTVLLGEPSDLAARLAACAQSAFEKAMGVAVAGNRVNEIGCAVSLEVERCGFSVIHALCGHGVGRSIHENPVVPNYYDSDQTDILTEGLVLAVEPIICAGSGRVVEGHDGWTVRTADRSLAAHHENTIVISGNSPLLLTAA